MILVYKAYLYRSYVSQTEACRLQCCTHCTVTMLQPSPHVTCHTCLPTPWSPGPVIVADTRRSCSCGAFCLAGSLCHALLSRVPRVGSRSRVTCRRGEAGAASRSPGHPRTCVLTGGSLLVSSVVSGHGPGLTAEAGTGQLSVSLCAAGCWLLV